MSIRIAAPAGDTSAERWRQWQLGYAESNRKAAIQARIAFALVFTMATTWLALQLLSAR